MVKITGVERASSAARHGVMAEDTLISINNNEINDVLDYRFYLTEPSVTLRIRRGEDEYTVTIRKGEYDDIGLDFETPLMDKKHSCKNGCIFCFIDQNPEGMRDSIYFKDDDSRLSFIHGNYITLTNMSDSDIDRIIKMRFSPINISVHTTNPDLRVKMMKNKRAGEVLSYLDRLKGAGIAMCGQIVLCRGINDGEELTRSMRDLAKYLPELSSVSIVPAGLTKFRDKLYPLTDFSKEEAERVIDAVDSFAEGLKKKCGTRLFFVADEFYLKAERPIPDTEYYEEYPQIENGVGMIRSFTDEFGIAAEDLIELSQSVREPRCVSVATSTASYPMISDMAERVMAICPNLTINVYKIINDFFGESITVTGLLTGKDIARQLKDKPLGDELLVPANALRYDDVFLCNMTLSELSETLGVKVRKCADGFELFDAIFGESL
ncbi:MAG: DUF512 domain-containing protein [Clostridia bacterium]|nr:DUF512 domain-containing protein [Clostridia bacterium]